MTTTSAHPVVVIGGGIAGLMAAALLSRDGVPVVLVEKASAPGGRATTRNRNGFLFNLGPHALYRAGMLNQTLKTLGVTVRGGIPGASGGYAIHQGRLHTLPTGLTSLISTGLLSLSGKFELARFQTRLPSIDTNAIWNEPLSSWLDANVSDATVRQLLAMLTRVTTFTNDPEHQSAGAALEQIKLGVKANVLYLHGGWQTIVEGLRRAAIANGVRIVTGAHAVAIDAGGPNMGRPEGLRCARAVRLADGTSIPASAVIIAGAPADVDALAATRFAAQLTPVRVATLDIALRSLPNPRANVAFGVDVPWYYSVHSAVADLAPKGEALIHVAKYLRPGERAGRDVEEELESLMDLMQPGWQTHMEHKQFVPSLTVTHAEITTTAAGPKGPALQPYDNVFIAGDWVGPRGQLSDRAAASATDAVASVQARQQLRAIA